MAAASTPPLRADHGRRGISSRLFIRALLGAISVVLVTLPTIVAVGAFVPAIPTVGRFGALVVTHLPALLVESSAAAALAVVALALGGGRWAKALVGMTGATTAAMLAVAVVTTVFAWQQGVSFDLFHMARAATEPPAPDERVAFATVEDIDLHADIWHARSTSAPSPALIYVHGGAFISGYLGSRPDLFNAVAEAGITVIDVEYRLSRRCAGRTLPRTSCARSVGPRRRPAGSDRSGEDRHGRRVGGRQPRDAGRVRRGYRQARVVVRSADRCASGRVRGRACGGPCGHLGRSVDLHVGAPFPEAYIGGTPAEFPDRYDMASPFRLLRADLPQTFLLTGSNDHFVFPNRVTGLADRIREAGAACTLVVAPFGDHGFDGFPNGYGNQLQVVLLPRFVAEVTT